MTSHEQWMQQALQLAQQAADHGEVPVGALIVKDQVVIGTGFNRPITDSDPTSHGEIVALRNACATLGNYRIPGSTLYVTLEPCSMCAGAIVHARVEKVIFGAKEPKAGAVVSNQRFFEQPFLNHRVSFEGGCLERQCSELISSFFAQRRAQKRSEKK